MSLDLNTIISLGRVSSAPEAGSAVKSESGGNFGDLLQKAVAEVNKAEIDADGAVQQLHAGGAKNVHEVMIALEKADISMRLLVQMRNKVVDAYQEIMRMQV